MAGDDTHRRLSGKVPKRRSSALRFLTSNSVAKAEANAQDHKKWEAEYLKGLRANRPARPSGSRPLPDSRAVAPEANVRAASALSLRPSACEPTDEPNLVTQERAASALSHRRAQSDMQRIHGGGAMGGRPSLRAPAARRSTRDFSGSTIAPKASIASSPLTYKESGMRWMEKQEARSLREALEEMDVREEAKVLVGAQDEASALVWQHMKEGDLHKGRRNFREHLQKGAHARSQSLAWAAPISNSGEALKAPTGDRDVGSEQPQTTSVDMTHLHGAVDSVAARTHIKWDSPEKKAYTNLAFNASEAETARRRSSGTKRRVPSGGPFRNPDDRIYEDPQDPARAIGGRSISSKIPVPQSARGPESTEHTRTSSKPFSPSTKIPRSIPNRTHQAEIHRNPPSQSRDPAYVWNDQSQLRSPAENHEETEHVGLESVDGREIRGDDIRAATSMRLKDRSPKLPSPSFVSNKPGRHIVSFDKDWQPQDEDRGSEGLATIRHADGGKRFKPSMPASVASSPAIPTISVSGDLTNDTHDTEPKQPKARLGGEVPVISISEEPTRRPLPTKKITDGSRPLPFHSSTAPVQSKPIHWSPAGHRSTAQCATCALPISGRIVSAASQRFHPHCFKCHHCSEPLECVAFYPEPDPKRAERLGRIQARLNGADMPDDQPGETAVDDGDESLRFFCHLDFHELFSPRCRSCKTPIESEVVVACGGTWHVGHFFCAECGDPFDPQTPFVEKDGYAWCVQCHAGRFSGKCKGCRKPVVEQGINALGAEWHESCFVCVVGFMVSLPLICTDFIKECNGPFEDGRFFTRENEQKPVCVQCEERRLKA